MLDYLRNLTKSKEEKQQEALNTYLDGALAPGPREQMEGELAQDEGLRAELDQMRLLQQQMRQLPQRRVRRNFVLDPALYGRPQREPLIQAYPLLRTATVMAAFLFIFALTANLFLNNSAGVMSDAEPAMMESEIREELLAEAVNEEAAAESMAMAEPAEEPFMSQDMAVDPEFELSEDEAEGALGLLEMAPEAAVELDGAAPLERPKTEALEAEENELAAAPTMEPVETAEAAPAAEPQSLATAEESAVQPSPRAAEEATAAGDETLFETNSIDLVILLLGIAFVVLITLTLLARRRL